MWVKEQSTMLQGLRDGAQQAMTKELLQDAATLITCRWHIDPFFQNIGGTEYVYFNNARFNVGANTIRAALGTITDHVDFQKSSVNTTIEQAVRYRECKLKWQVPDQITDGSTYGWAGQEQESTSTMAKRKR